jgi:2-dehydro-3-deoxyphosphogluconate aldolase / (4S)-4-hydroxy-2-oxoglutarate aldolase
MDPIALAQLRRQRIVAAIRAPTPGAARDAAMAVAEGGIPILEITFTVPEALRVIAELARREDLLVGAGTVLSAGQARDALAAGARFVVAPNVSAEVASATLAAGALYCPGAYTTGEILAARQAGAHLVKVYPVGVVGGPAYIRVIRDPLPDIPLLAAGGTTLENLVPFLEVGCVAVGLGAALCDPELVAAGRFEEIARRARAFVGRIEEARASGVVEAVGSPG